MEQRDGFRQAEFAPSVSTCHSVGGYVVEAGYTGRWMDSRQPTLVQRPRHRAPAPEDALSMFYLTGLLPPLPLGKGASSLPRPRHDPPPATIPFPQDAP